jgi:hypothetical protein
LYIFFVFFRALRRQPHSIAANTWQMLGDGPIGCGHNFPFYDYFTLIVNTRHRHSGLLDFPLKCDISLQEFLFVEQVVAELNHSCTEINAVRLILLADDLLLLATHPTLKVNDCLKLL